MFPRMAAVLVIASLAGPAGAGASERKDLQVLNDIVKQVDTYAWFTIFDDVNVSIDNGMVTLSGKVTMPYKRDDIAKRVARVDGVRGIENHLDVLPVSPFDDDLRHRIARAIYGHPAFWNYAAMPVPPIHIVVDHGHVTLTGVVNSEVDRALARSLASRSQAFSVKSELKTAAEARRALEGA
jgi:osmotically-inducible protein OsmY